jgi:hypothetical protein
VGRTLLSAAFEFMPGTERQAERNLKSVGAV